MVGMLRVFLWIVGVLGAIIGALAVLFFFVLSFEPDIKRETHALDSGAQIQIDFSFDGIRGEVPIDYVLSLQHPDGSIEEIDRDRTYEFAPTAPFELRNNGNSLVLRCDALFYERPQRGGNWIKRGDLKSDDTMLSVARLLMPRVYVKLEQYQVGPPIPKYVLERWDESNNVVVLLQSKTSDADEGNQTSKQEQYKNRVLQKWPRRLVFRDFQFDQQSTLALTKGGRKTK